MTHYFKRVLTPQIISGLKDTPAVFLNGPRQAGKSTLANEVAKNCMHGDYVTFDNVSLLSAATHDPKGFLQSFTKPVVIDEVQMAPDLFRALKMQIDEMRHNHKTRANGQFLLTSSANIMALPELAHALVGRMQILTLFPLSIGETIGKQAGFIDALFDKNLQFMQSPFEMIPLKTIISSATFPELTSNRDIDQAKWFESYLTTLLQRDIRNLAEIEKLSAMPNLLKLIAARVGSLLNDASLARDTGLNTMTYRRYRTLLSEVFLLITVPPWYRNINKRLVKSPKIYLTDTGLLCYLLGIDINNLQNLKINNPNLFGMILENLVASELTKQLSWQRQGSLYHFRTYDNQEIDFVIERKAGQLIAIEVKSAEIVDNHDFKILRQLKEILGKNLLKGIVLYLGKDIIPFGEDLYAMPFSALWNFGAKNL